MRGSSDRVKMTKKPRRAEAWLQINRELINRGPHGAEAAVGEAAALGAAEAGAPRPAGAAEAVPQAAGAAAPRRRAAGAARNGRWG